MTFVRLPKGTFYMGWNGTKKGVKTEIKEDFEIAVHDVTRGSGRRSWATTPATSRASVEADTRSRTSPMRS